MANSQEYLGVLYNLLPQGPAWPREDDGSLTSDILKLIAGELANADTQIGEIFYERDPASTVTMLDTWLDEWGLPDECMTAIGETQFPQDKLQQALVAKVKSWGLPFKEAAAVIGQVFGFDVTVTAPEYYTVMSPVDHLMYDKDWTFTVFVETHSAELIVEYFAVNWTVDQPLARWGDRVYECMIRKIVPAHLIPIFQYTAG